MDDWLVRRLRMLLKFVKDEHIQYTEEHLPYEKPYSWRAIAREIAENEGWDCSKKNLKNIDERLRRFVDGEESKETGEICYTTPRDSFLNAIVRFLADDPDDPENLFENNPIAAQEALAMQAVLHLSRFLEEPFTQTRELKLDQIKGRYSAQKQVGNVRIEIELRLDGSESGHCLDANLVERTERMLGNDQAPIEVGYSGWGVISPEDLLILFLKNTLDSANRVYIAPGIAGIDPEDQRVKHLLLYQYDKCVAFKAERFLIPEGIDSQQWGIFNNLLKLNRKNEKLDR